MPPYSFRVLGLERVKKMPDKYILDRWKKTLKRKHTKIKCSHDSSRLEPTKRRYDLCKQFYNIAKVVAASETLHRVLDSVWTMLSEPNVSKSNTNDTTNHADDQNSNVVDENENILEIYNPSHVSRKGRKRKKILQSAVDKIVEHGRKKKLQSNKRLQN
ncbi:hypothetical protein PIB30_022832, partial [Stylosanthes scabra]|nr:hypothetical protein [Stylosanthes scabra]